MIWPLVYVVIALAVYRVSLGAIGSAARYRKGAALGIAVLWPGLTAVVAASLLLDGIEWALRKTRRWLAGAWS
ncbi:hypothetical protein [Allopontixanthobacter sp.]|uniref:hypothetical protein n=1 Tax=Allopontixanthobacter sp. TaxID=2906452 RepID=UPI002ABD0ACD|nr:hypothetical protein [Allopontixanthobacter sp.]MDZ4307557.1 hypothetical protein [Allopontixanthobacter sp.]